MSVFIVAEAGVNHLGDRAKMLALCDAAKAAGADAVKFQAYSEHLLFKRRGYYADDVHAGSDRCQLGYKPEHLDTALLLRKAELSDADLDAIASHCKKIGIKWFASVFDPSQIERVLSRGACALKIGHAEAGWNELVDECILAHADEQLYVSYPSIDAAGASGTRRWNVRGVKCVCEYPATSPPELHEVSSDECRGDGSDYLRGFSSHYTDYRIPAAAALRGAEYIEFHIATEADQPEAAWSLMPDDAKKCCELIREYETWL